MLYAKQKFENIDDFFQFINNDFEKSQTQKKPESFEDILKTLSCKDSQKSEKSRLKNKSKSFEEILYKLSCPIEDLTEEEQENSDFFQEIPSSSSSSDFLNFSKESSVVQKTKQEILNEILGISPKINTILKKRENLDWIFSFLRGEDNTKNDSTEEDIILIEESFKIPSQNLQSKSPEILEKNKMEITEILQESSNDSMEIIFNNNPLENLQKTQHKIPSQNLQSKSPEILEKNKMEITEILQESTDDSVEIIFNNNPLENLQKTQQLLQLYKNQSPVKTPPKIQKPKPEINFLKTLENPKKFDIHQSLLNHLEELPNSEEIQYLLTSLRQPNFRFYSHGFRKIPTPKPFKKTLIKKHWKGKRKFYRLKKLKKTTFIESPNLKNFEETEKEEIFTQLTQVQVQIKDMSSFSLSKHSSFISNDSSENLSSGSQDSSKGIQLLKSGLNSALKDKNLRYNEEEDNPQPIKTRKEIIQRIENIFLDVLEAYDKNEDPAFILIRKCWENCVFKNGRYQLKDGSLALKTITPRHKCSRNKFFLMLYLLDKTRKLLIGDIIETKREIYYQIKNFVKSQGQTDDALFEVSRLLDVGPWDLNVLSQRGLVFGDLNLKLLSGEVINCNVPGCHIPINVADIIQIDTMAHFILVVEKDSIFHKLLEEDLPNKLIRPFILISGSGFPAFNTQLFLNKLWMVMKVPVFILVDPDPYGIQIMFQYRFGSMGSVHVSHQLTVPKAQWLGVFPSEIRNLDLARRDLTEQDQKLVKTFLESPAMKEHPRIKAELECLLDRNEKADIEGLIKNDYLSQTYIRHKFHNKIFF